MLSLLRLERKQKNYSNPFRIGIFLFLSYSFGIENHTRFQTKISKSEYPFSDQNGAKTPPDGAAHTVPIWLI